MYRIELSWSLCCALHELCVHPFCFRLPFRVNNIIIIIIKFFLFASCKICCQRRNLVYEHHYIAIIIASQTFCGKKLSNWLLIGRVFRLGTPMFFSRINLNLNEASVILVEDSRNSNQQTILCTVIGSSYLRIKRYNYTGK